VSFSWSEEVETEETGVSMARLKSTPWDEVGDSPISRLNSSAAALGSEGDNLSLSFTQSSDLRTDPNPQNCTKRMLRISQWEVL